jgi:hypothetical protein
MRRSSLGDCIASWIHGKENILIALESYFDGSNIGGWEKGSLVTLAGYATDDEIWKSFDEGWNKVLNDDSRRPAADHLHMRKAAHFVPPFDHHHGWNMKRVGILITDLLEFVQTIDKKRFRQFACTVDLDDYRKVRNEGLVLDSSTENCILHCPRMMLAWYTLQYPGLIHSAHYFFDVDEPFKQPFEDMWKREKSDVLKPGASDMIWSVIKTVTTVTMKDKPALQAADLLAWASNRSYVAQYKHEPISFGHLEPVMKQIIPSSWVVWDESKFRQHYRNGRLEVY